MYSRALADSIRFLEDSRGFRQTETECAIDTQTSVEDFALSLEEIDVSDSIQRVRHSFRMTQRRARGTAPGDFIRMRRGDVDCKSSFSTNPIQTGAAMNCHRHFLSRAPQLPAIFCYCRCIARSAHTAETAKMARTLRRSRRSTHPTDNETFASVRRQCGFHVSRWLRTDSHRSR